MAENVEKSIVKGCARSAFVKATDAFLGSKYFVAVLALCVLGCNIFGWELYLYPAVCVVGCYACLFCKDLRCVIPIALFLYVSPSMKNEPSKNPQSVFYPEHGMWIIALFAALLVVALLVRIVLRERRSIFTTKRRLIGGALALGVAFLVGGIDGEAYTLQNLRYIVLLFLSLFGLYYCLTALIDWKSVEKDYFAWLGLILGLTVAVELAFVYIEKWDQIFNENGTIVRWLIFTGWASYNNMGAMLIFCLPCAFYLAATKKAGWFFNLLGQVLFAATLFTCSRASIATGAIVYLVCAFILLGRRQNFKQNFVLYGLLFIALVASLVVFREEIETVFKFVLDAQVSNNSRWDIFKQAWLNFLNRPIFGKGFFGWSVYGIGVGEVALLPAMAHNTPLQLLASCGAVGLGAYAYHRYQTIKLVFKRRSTEKTFLGLCITAVLIACLLDCHIFLLGPGLSYSAFLAFLEKSDEEKGNGLRAPKNAKEMLL